MEKQGGYPLGKVKEWLGFKVVETVEERVCGALRRWSEMGARPTPRFNFDARRVDESERGPKT
jgi:hypothetical protein